jgi:superfamily I DNA and RNA helicase
VKTSWWRKQTELDDDQKRVIDLPPNGRYLITGPPGSGKTNLLLLRAMFLSGSGLKDVIFLTVGRTLKEFIATGVGGKGLLAADQIFTFRTWVMKYLGEHSRPFMNNPPAGSYDETRVQYAAELDRVSRKMPPIYNAILIDEVQDLNQQELASVARLSTRLMVAGDARQQIYSGGEGLESAQTLCLEHIRLRYHYRIGRKICEAADSVYPPLVGTEPLSQTCNYDENEFASSRQIFAASSLDDQVDLAIKEIQVQLKAFPGDSIGIFLPNNAYIANIRDRLLGSAIGSLVSIHDNTDRAFEEDKQIYVMTIHSAKGTEFRAIHLLGAEAIRGNAGTRKIVFTAFTRAKTSLSVYYTGRVSPFIAAAFTQPSTPALEDLFE